MARCKIPAIRTVTADCQTGTFLPEAEATGFGEKTYSKAEKVHAVQGGSFPEIELPAHGCSEDSLIPAFASGRSR